MNYKDMEHIKEERKEFFPLSLYHSFETPFVVEKAQDYYYYSPQDNNPYIDLYNNVCHIGHSNPKIKEAVENAYSTINIHTRYFQENLTKYVKHLKNYLSDGYKILFTNSGSESNDLALQIALRHSGTNRRFKIGSFKRSYHGTTWLCNQVSHLTPTGLIDNYEKDIDVHFFDSDESPNTLYNFPEVNSFILETFQGVGGNQEISTEWLQHIRSRVKIMICDEVQTGFGRTGNTFWAFQKANILPDIITCGKPIANGYPMGACIFRKELEQYIPSTYFNTFGGNSVACQVAKVVLEELEEKKLQEHSKEMGEYLKSELLDYQNDIVKVTGSGLYLGVHFSEKINTKEMVERLKDHHFIVGIGYNNILRIKPPMTITKEAIDKFVQTVGYILISMANKK
jgi:4-aminobutyrate aminotransferase-like enzyme